MSVPFGFYNALPLKFSPRLEAWYAQLWDRCGKRLRYRGSRRRASAIRRLRVHWLESDVLAAIAEAERDPAPRRRRA